MHNITTKATLVAMVVASTVLGFSGLSFADTLAPQPSDPSAGSVAAGVNTARTWVTTYGVPAMIAAIVFGVLVAAGFRWLRKASRSAVKG